MIVLLPFERSSLPRVTVVAIDPCLTKEKKS